MDHDLPTPEQLTIEWLSATEGVRDVTCPRCAYLLAGIREPRCPECGNGFRVGVRTVRLVDMPFITGCIVLCLGFSASLGLAVVFWTMAIFDSSLITNRNYDFIIASSVEIILGAALLWGWIVLRRVLRRQSFWIRWLIIVGFGVMGFVALWQLVESI